jgi:thiol-disulfide isomerase/thioredoxin
MTPRNAAAVLVGGVALVGLYLLTVSSLSPSPSDDMRHASAPRAVPAPEVAFETLEGVRASLTEHRGQVVLLNLWGTWCPPCVTEIPHLVEVHQAIEPLGGTVIGLAVDSGSPEEIRGFWRDRLELEPAYPLWMGTNREARRHFEAFGLPHTLVIDRDGLVRERFLGVVTREILLKAVDAYL